MKSLPFFVATCLLPLTHAIACYKQGDTTPDLFLMPCNNETSFSTCCRTQETCLPNGLCENEQIDNGTTTYTYFREGCTDPSWNSPACLTSLNTCPNDGNESVELVEVTPCPNDAVMFCCGSNNTACCDNNPITLAAQPIVSTNSTTSSTSIPTPTTIALSAPTATPKPSSSPSTLSPGVKAGIVVASVAATIVLAALLFYILSHRRRTGGPTSTSYSAGPSSEATMVGIEAVSSAPPYRYGGNSSSTYVKPGMEMEIEQPVREDEGNALKYEDHRKFRRFSNEIL